MSGMNRGLHGKDPYWGAVWSKVAQLPSGRRLVDGQSVAPPGLLLRVALDESRVIQAETCGRTQHVISTLQTLAVV